MAFRYSRRKSSVFRSGARLMTQELDFRPLFTAMDRDCNGFIDKNELRATMWDIGMHVSDRDLDLMMKVAGVVVKDQIFYEDFVKMMGGTVGRSQRKLMIRSAHGRKLSDMSLLVEGEMEDKTTQAMRVAFAAFDHDGDGLISTSETNFTLTSLGMRIQPDDLSRVFKTIDKNGDGLISFEEFRDAMLDYEVNSKKKVFLPPPVSGVDDVTDDDKRQSIVHVIFDGGLVIDGNDVILPADDVDGFGSDDEDDDDDDVEYVGENQQRFMKEAFRIFDKDKDGVLSECDLRYTMWHLGLDLSRDDVYSMFTVLGINPGGKIPFDVFRNMWFGRTEKTLETICLRGAFTDKTFQHRPSIFAASELTDWEVPQEFKYHVDQKKHYQDLLTFVFQEFSEELNEKFKDSTHEEKQKLPVLSESQENIEEEQKDDEQENKHLESSQPFRTTSDTSDKNIYDTVYDGSSKHTDEHTDKHIDKCTDKHKDKYTDKHTDKYADNRNNKQNDNTDKGIRCSSDTKTVADVYKPPQTDAPVKRSLPFASSQKAVPPSTLPLPQHPFLKVTSRVDPPQFVSKEVEPDLQSEKIKENLKSLRRQEFLNLSKMTDSNKKANLIHPFAFDNQKNSYSSSTSGFSLSPVYDVPYPSPSKKSKPQDAFQDSKPSYNTASSYRPSYHCSKDLPFLLVSTSNSSQHSYTSYKNVDKIVEVTSACRSPHSVSPTSRPFLSSTSYYNKYPDPTDRNLGGSNMNHSQYHVVVSESPFPSLFASSYYPSSTKVFSSNQTRDTPRSFYDQEKRPVAPSTFQSGKGILLRQKAHYISGEIPNTLWNKREESYRSSRNPSPLASNIATTNKSVNFKLSTEDGIKIMSCGSEEIYPEDEGPLLTSSDSENLKFDRIQDPSYTFTLHRPQGTTKPRMYFNAGLGRKGDRSSLSSEDSDMRSSSSVASSRKDHSDSSADNTLTLLTIKQSYTSEDKLEKESSSLVIGRIDKPSKHDPPMKSFPSVISSSISRTLGKSDSQLLSKLSRSDIPLHQVPLNKAGPSKTLHFVSPNHVPSTPEMPGQLRLDVLSANQLSSSPRGSNKLSGMLANRLPSMASPSNQTSPIKLNKLSHFEGVMPIQCEGSQKRKSVITLEKFSWKDENIVQPATFMEHERTKTKTDNKVTLRASLKLKSATVDGNEKLALSQKVAIASKTLAGNQSERRQLGSGKKVVLSRLDLSKGRDLIASGVTMDTYKLYREPTSVTGMRWNAVRRLMQHMCTDQHGNKHFFFVGSLFPRKSAFTPKDYAWKAFKVFDKNLDGFISWFELNTTFKDLGMKKTNFELCCIMDENDSNGDGVIDYFEFCKMFKRSAYTFCAKRAAQLYEVHSSPKHNDEDILVRTKFKYLTNHPDTPENGWVEQLKTVFKMTDIDSSGKVRLSDLGKNFKSISSSKSLANDLFDGGLVKDSRRIGFEEFYQMVFDHQKEKVSGRPMLKSA